MAIDSTKKVAINTIIMYIRMIVLICISFYASRLLLSTLGIENYGIYSVVGSIAVSFTAVKTLFSESLQRFFNVAKGKSGDTLKEQVLIFNIGIYVHLILAIIFAVVVEVIGLWLLETKLSIPPERFDVAKFVFHMTIIATVFSMFTITYDAVIIANQCMSFYAVISIFDAVLKLLFIFLLPVIGYDNLMEYSLLLVTIPLSTLLFQFFYCKRFDECKYQFCFDRKLFKEVLNLSGWNFVGNISFSLIHEGINMLLNVFGGVVFNAARAISYQVKGVISQLSGNTLVAVRPYIMQQSVNTFKQDYYKNICMISRLSFLSVLLPVAPLIIYCTEIFDIWLKEVPENAVLFTRLVLLGLLIRAFHEPFNIMNMAVGKIKRMMLIEVFTMTMFLVFVYAALKITGILWLPFALLSLMELCIILFLLANAVNEIDFMGSYYVRHVLMPSFLLSIVTGIVGYLFYTFKDKPFLILQLFIFCCLMVGICYFFLDKKEKSILKRIIKR